MEKRKEKTTLDRANIMAYMTAAVLVAVHEHDGPVAEATLWHAIFRSKEEFTPREGDLVIKGLYELGFLERTETGHCQLTEEGREAAISFADETPPNGASKPTLQVIEGGRV